MMMPLLMHVRQLGRAFIFLSASQAIFAFGAMVLQFGLGVWVFQHTGSALDFSTIMVATTLPPLLVLPLAGSVADRMDRRKIVFSADIASIVATVVMAGLVSRAGLRLEHVITFNVFISLVGSFRAPAAQALVATLVPAEQLSRASGVMGIGNSLSGILAPTVGGALMVFSGLAALVWIDVATLIVGAVLLLKGALFNIKYDKTSAGELSPSGGVFFSVRNALSFLTAEPLMGVLLVYMVLQGALVAVASYMLTPLVLSRHSSTDLGLILTCGTIGAAAGSSALIVTGQKSRLMISILLSDALLALCIVIAGVATSVLAYCLCTFTALFAGGFAAGCAEALWMRKIDVNRLGSIFALTGTVGILVTALATVGGGLLVDRVFGSAMGGRPIALLYVISGSSGLLLSLLALTQMRLRNMDVIVPDAVR